LAPAARAVFYYDLLDAESYLAAERALQVVPGAEWTPIAAPAAGHDGLADGEVERRITARALQPLRRPPAGGDGRPALLAATYAKQIGRGVAFSLAAFRQAFAGGRSLADRDTVLIAAAACEMHPTAVLRALDTRGVAGALDRASSRAVAAGVSRVPAVCVDGAIFAGDDGLEKAGRALAGDGSHA
jgi:2-hydroxychromene-2-carboxylate isomerase